MSDYIIMHIEHEPYIIRHATLVQHARIKSCLANYVYKPEFDMPASM